MENRVLELATHRLENAYQCLESAKKLIEINDYKGAANRSYYAIFHSMRSILALDKKDFSKHSGVSSYFRREYIKTGIFKNEMSDIISEAFEIRSNSDYDDFYLISRDEVLEQINNAEIFYSTMEQYINTKIKISDD